DGAMSPPIGAQQPCTSAPVRAKTGKNDRETNVSFPGTDGGISHNGPQVPLDLSSPRKMFPMFSHESPDPASYPPERFVAEVFSELPAETIQQRWENVNVILRMSMLTGLQMQLDATLNLLCDMAAEITQFDRALMYFWDEAQELMQLRLSRNVDK